MAKQTVNIGSFVGDPTADITRDAFDKINDNFNELYASFTYDISQSQLSEHNRSFILMRGNSLTYTLVNSLSIETGVPFYVIQNGTGFTIDSTAINANIPQALQDISGSIYVITKTGTTTGTDNYTILQIGVSDHGALTGLADDDHPQYLNDARHDAITGNPHGVTATDVGLGNVDNTSDLDKPVSTTQQAALDAKQDTNLTTGKIWVGSSTYTTESGVVHLDEGNGRMGIGTTSPSTALDVVGEITLNDGGNSVYIGTDAGSNDDRTDNRNVGIGFYALQSNTTGNNNTSNGYSALRSNTTGSYNTANGSLALRFNTTGNNNTANGYSALRENTTGSHNIANGYNALYSNTTGNHNIANGYFALFSNTTGNNNTANGSLALRFNTTGANNMANGYNALFSNTTGNNNTANGYLSLRFNTTGVFNTASGSDAGSYIADGSTANTTGDYNVFLGAGTKALADNDQNEIVIGYNAIGLGSNTVVLGNDSITDTYLKGDVHLGNSAILKGYTVASLPTGVVGMRVYVTDAITPIYGATVVGGGYVTVPVFFDGTNWIYA